MSPSLASDRDGFLLDPTTEDQPVGSIAPTPLPIECILFPDPQNLQAGFMWPGPDPLSHTTETDDILLYMSAFVPARLLHWVVIHLTGLDRITGDTIEEHLFHLSPTKSARGDLCWVRRQMLSIISGPMDDEPRLFFRLFLRPGTEPLTYIPDTALPSQANLPSATCLNPDLFVHSLIENYR
jgi:hypothetical protein